MALSLSPELSQRNFLLLLLLCNFSNVLLLDEPLVWSSHQCATSFYIVHFHYNDICLLRLEPCFFVPPHNILQVRKI
ncbi:hypothetical protein CPB85DRAFT_428651 [Mucidula mucida]|nr:hypothetical protein CPB85DRAFT_428651 [Mucidula mucida]